MATELYRLVIIFSGTHDCEDIYNDEKAAVEAFKEATKHPFAIAVGLYTCVWVANKLANKHRSMYWVKGADQRV